MDFGISRIPPSNAWWPTKAGQLALSRPSAAEGGGRSLADRRVALAPFGLELLEPDHRHLGVLGAVDRLDGGQDRLAVLPRHKRQAVADQVHDAGLHDRLRINRGDRLGKALESIHHGDQDVVDTARLELVDHLEPEFGAFALFDPQPEHILLAIGIERERHIDGLVLDQALVANLDAQSVKKHHRIDRVERPVLPFPPLVKDRIGDTADEIGRHVGSIEFGQVAWDLSHRHAAGIEAQNLVVETGEMRLAFGDQLRLEAADTIARHRNFDLAILGQERLRARPVAAVAFAASCRIALLIAEVLGQLRSHGYPVQYALLDCCSNERHVLEALEREWIEKFPNRNLLNQRKRSPWYSLRPPRIRAIEEY